MQPPLSLEDVVATSDDVAVRRRFDSRNLRLLIVLLLIFTIVTVVEFGIALGSPRHGFINVAISAVNILLNVGLLFLLRDVFRIERAGAKGVWGPARVIRNHASATLISYLIVQYALFLAYTERVHDWYAWAFIFPFLTLGSRLLPAEFVLLHGVFFGGAAVVAYLDPVMRQPRAVLIGVGIVNALALAIENFLSRRLRKEIVSDWSSRRTQAVEQMRMRDELQYARELQLSLLPESAPHLDWIDLAGVSVPATEVGGDYFDYFVDGSRIAIVSGDVAGHGLACGLVVASLRSGFTLLRSSLTDPGSVLTRLHDLVAQTSRRRMLATAAVVLIDRDAKRATIASAGHPPVLVRSNGAVRAIEIFAPPLGVRLPTRIPQVQIDFQRGDIFVLHSDGVYEARNAKEESYGLDRLMAVVNRQSALSAQALRDAIVSDVECFRGTAPQTDDVTVVVARIE